MDLSVVMPAYNEKKSLENVILRWTNHLNSCNIFFEIVVCLDASTDGSLELLNKLVCTYPIIIDHSMTRRGYGGAVLAGINKAKGKYILCIDSDGQCMPDSFNEVWSIKEESNIVIGYRYPRCDPFIRIVYSKLFLIFHKILFPSLIKDPSCPYVLAHRNIFILLEPWLNYMKEGFWWGFIASALKNNLTVNQIQIVHFRRFDGKSDIFKLEKIPKIIYINLIGLLKIRFYD